MLHIEDLRLTRGKGASAYRVRLPRLDLEAGEVMALVGNSGSGKSTLLEGVGLLLAPTHVSRFVLGDGQDMAGRLAGGDGRLLARLRAERLGFVLQSGGLLPYLNAEENILLPRRLLRLPDEDEQVSYAIETLGLGALLHKMPAALSIGERQRVACVRALAHGPGLLLADEPTSALDPDNARTLFGLLIEIARRRRMAAIVVTHDRDLVREFDVPCLRPMLSRGESVFCLHEGKEGA
ncbi:ABC transporter ATP-binding protein [Achromobacter aloeverae]